jgi:hypothetical protein
MKYIKDHDEHNDTAKLRDARHARGNGRMPFLFSRTAATLVGARGF